MSGRRNTAVIALAAVSLGASLWLAPTAFAGDPLWNGHYILTFPPTQRTGPASRPAKPEYAHRASYSITSKCSAGVCVATVNDPPPPKNQSMPQSVKFTWNGSQWVRR